MNRLIKGATHRLVPNPLAREQRYVIGHALDWLWAWYTDPVVRRYQARLRALSGKYRGCRCFIMGNGPSLNAMDLDKLAHDYVWGSNRCYLLFDRIKWRPAFYTAVDTRVTPDNADEINTLFAALPGTLFFFPLHFRMRRVLRSAKNTYWYNEIRFDQKNLPAGSFTTDAVKHVCSVCTVTIAAMQLAVHLGFNPIYLIGCDTDYKVPDTSVYEDDKQDLIVATQNDDHSHFVPDYFGVGKKYHQPHPERMVFHYEQAKQVCDLLGVEVFNATVGGKLEVFPRVSFESLFA